MLNIIKNKTYFPDQEIVKMVRRENNSKRNYLLVNSCQGKHVPVDPDKTVFLFSSLAGEVRKNISDKKILFIGFAETATAVGAVVAMSFKNSYYVHTTREKDPSRTPVAVFSEEHSHATEQILYCDDWENIIKEVKHVVFVEDEITTGKTIMNFIEVLKEKDEVPFNMKFSACSILNGMDAETERKFSEKNINFYWLARIEAKPDSDETYSFTPAEAKRTSAFNVREIAINGKKDPRKGLKIAEYKEACSELAEKIASEIDVKDKRIAVIGTEEFMYPAINAALRLKKSGPVSVVTHSTTRSPIIADKEKGYPLRSRYRLDSFYEKERKTFIYNSDEAVYDLVIVITDSEKENYNFESFASSFPTAEEFVLVRWVK